MQVNISKIFIMCVGSTNKALKPCHAHSKEALNCLGMQLFRNPSDDFSSSLCGPSAQTAHHLAAVTNFCVVDLFSIIST